MNRLADLHCRVRDELRRHGGVCGDTMSAAWRWISEDHPKNSTVRNENVTAAAAWITSYIQKQCPDSFSSPT